MTHGRTRSSWIVLLALVGALVFASDSGAADSDSPGAVFPLVVEVVGADGKLAADASVSLLAFPPPPGTSMLVDECARDLPSPEIPVASARTDATGRVKFDGLATAMYRVVAEPAGGARAVVRQPVARGVPVAPLRVSTRTGITLRGVARRGGGAPVAGVTVVVEPEQVPWFVTDPALRFRATSDERGAWAIHGLAPDSYDVWTWRAPGVLDRVETVDVRAPRTLDVAAPVGGTFRVRVIAKEDGSPLAGADVEAWDLARNDGYFRLGRATTDASGTCAIVLGRARAAVSFVSIRCAGRRPWVAQLPVVVVNDGHTVTREYAVPRAEPLAGRVLGPDGPVAGARVRFDPGPLRPWDWVFAGHGAQTDAAGRFQLDALRRFQTLLVADADGFVRGDVWVTPGASSTREPVIRLRRPRANELPIEAKYAGTVRYPDGTPAAGAQVWSRRGATVSAADGSFVIDAADGRDRAVWAELPGFDGMSLASDPERVVIPLLRQPSVRGRLTSSLGADVTGARILIAEARVERNRGPWADWTQVRGVRAGSDGRWETFLPRPEPPRSFPPFAWSQHEYVVAVEFPGHAPSFSPPFSTQGRTEPHVVDLSLDAGAELSGRVVAFDGRPAASVPVVVIPYHQSRDPRTSWPPSRMPGEQPWRATTAADGTFTVPHLLPGRYTVTAQPAGAPQWGVTVEVPSDGTPVEVRLRE